MQNSSKAEKEKYNQLKIKYDQILSKANRHKKEAGLDLNHENIMLKNEI